MKKKIIVYHHLKQGLTQHNPLPSKLYIMHIAVTNWCKVLQACLFLSTITTVTTVTTVTPVTVVTKVKTV